MIRVLIADDSSFMRKILSDLFALDNRFEVAGTAINGKDAIEKVLKLKPDVLTLDVNMPLMDGLQALEVIMKECPLPVVMISSLTRSGAEETIKALELGAVDFINKTGGSISRIDTISDEITGKCYAAARANLQSVIRYTEHNKVGRSLPESFFSAVSLGKLIAIGTSTGGPKALQQVITRLPADLPCGVVIVQHMPPGFTKSLAERLNQLSAVSVKEAEDGERIKPAHVYIAPGNYHMRVRYDTAGGIISLNQDPPIGNHRPSVNALFESVVPFGRKLVSVILTGMGNDGMHGMENIKKVNGYIIAEDKSTSVVYGMPKAVIDLGIADEVLPIDKIADAIVNAVKRK
ncbi:protein-glutamate methylesterase/protein-glutamine glutaminase [Pectinatus haikarae]|uniref:Protein-glutamate methylesterase/protein-glutamine glutaminase n=1 Tax=Pectinatus haikarae TaxID=349096 RepID=A0ABT9Y803_9FIRM|nr:chemotaxis response regulator protein-glutamate methylesterase [Pectinatus haikarae]MDQ0203758.1 two-component system chemotaxis response regulator CheB [Pectinatus haikarae]